MNPMIINTDQNYASRNEVTEMKRDLDKLKNQFKNELGCCYEFRNCLSFSIIIYILVIVYLMKDVILQDHNDLHKLMDFTNNKNTTNTNITNLRFV